MRRGMILASCYPTRFEMERHVGDGRQFGWATGGPFDPTRIGEFESWWQRTIGPSPCSAEPAFSAAASFGICALSDFPFGSRQGIRIGGIVSLVLMIRNFNR